MTERTSPFGNYNFTVDLKGPHGPETPLGGFSDVSGLEFELTVSEYRSGNDPEMHVRKIPGLHKVGDVTLKRGVVKSDDLWAWISSARLKSVNAQRDVVVTMNDEAGSRVQAWTLRGCIPMKYTGPTFAAKGGGDVAMEELTLSIEGLEYNR